MGGKSSKAVTRTVTKPFKNYNIAERAQRVVEDHKTNPKVAPYYPSTADKIEDIISETPEIKEELEKKDIVTIERMNKLHVTTSGTKPSLKLKELPQRKTFNDPHVLMECPETIPKGKVSLLNLASILEQYKTDPKLETVKSMAKDFNLDLQTAGRIVKFYAKLDYGDKILTDEKEEKLKDKFVQIGKKVDEKASEKDLDEKKESISADKPLINGGR